jgi:hypothetical protein
MEEDRMPKKIFTQELEGTRRRGRPRERWREEVDTIIKMQPHHHRYQNIHEK